MDNNQKKTVIPQPILIIVTTIWTIALTSLLFVYIENVSTDKKEVAGVIAEEESSKIEYLDEVDHTAVKQFNFTVCYSNICKPITSAKFVDTTTGQILPKYKFDEVVIKEIVPYYDEIFAKKVTVKNTKGEFRSRAQDIVPDYSNLYEDVSRAVMQMEEEITIALPSKISPGTDGELYDKYIEIDNSQQKLYVWIGGNIDKVIDLSGPRYGWQVYGVFPIVDKGLSPIAPGGKYMPYWMAFYYSKKQNSWYGLHALIWMYREDGSKWFEPESNIGRRESAGCIRMTLQDAKYLYERFEKGDYIVIHE